MCNGELNHGFVDIKPLTTNSIQRLVIRCYLGIRRLTELDYLDVHLSLVQYFQSKFLHLVALHYFCW